MISTGKERHIRMQGELEKRLMLVWGRNGGDPIFGQKLDDRIEDLDRANCYLVPNGTNPSGTRSSFP